MQFKDDPWINKATCQKETFIHDKKISKIFNGRFKFFSNTIQFLFFDQVEEKNTFVRFFRTYTIFTTCVEFVQGTYDMYYISPI